MMHRPYTAGERIADGAIHVIGISAGATAATLLVLAGMAALSLPIAISLTIYAVTMVAMFSCSAAYNLVDGPRWKARLRRLDQAAIFIKIAGTYTPFAIVKLGGALGFGLLTGVWAVAIAGATVKLIFAQRWERTAIALYLALGWAGLLVLWPLVRTVEPGVLILLVTGGILYSVGVVFHVWSSLPYQNALWHLFVLVATATHFAAVAWAMFG